MIAKSYQEWEAGELGDENAVTPEAAWNAAIAAAREFFKATRQLPDGDRVFECELDGLET